MRTENLRVNQLSEEAYAWYRRYLEALDAKDIDAYADFLSEDVELIMNNAEPVTGGMPCGPDSPRTGSRSAHWSTNF